MIKHYYIYLKIISKNIIESVFWIFFYSNFVDFFKSLMQIFIIFYHFYFSPTHIIYYFFSIWFYFQLKILISKIREAHFSNLTFIVKLENRLIQ